MNIGEIAPTIDALLAMEADELGLRFLTLLNRQRMLGGSISLRAVISANFFDVVSMLPGGSRGGPYKGREEEAKAALIEAWAWLEGQALIVPVMLENAHTPHPDARALSRRAVRLAEEPRLALTARLLPKDALHPIIREDVWSLFHRGRYDTAVFEAMKAVEVSVREASGLAATDYGIELMRKAFHKESGRLSDMSALPAERDARSFLFVGAIGSYKNPQSHRRVDLDDPNEAAEIIMLANHLLRIVDDRAATRVR